MTRGASLALLALLVAAGAAARIQTALSHEKFDTRSAEGMVLSDPGLLYYLTERVVEAGGAPHDFRADPRIEHPATVDVPARFTVGQEFVVAAVRRLVGPDPPLHVLCVQVTGVLASLAVLGVWGLARELSGSRRWAALAAFLFASLPASYRTIGFVLVREDLALPLFAAHLWLAARAHRTGGAASAAGAGLLLGAAMATWHAIGFLATLEAAAVFAWFLRSGRNPFEHHAGRLLLACVALPCLAVPVLWAKGAVLAPPMVLAGGLLVAALAGRGGARGARVLLALGGTAALFGASRLFARALGTAADFAHVSGVLLAKVARLGALPPDPRALDFEARMMWQGPFATLSLGDALAVLQTGLLVLPFLLALGLARLARGPREHGADGESVLLAFLTLACAGAWLVSRTTALVGLLLPVALVLALRRLLTRTRSPLPRLGVAALAGAQLLWFGSWLARQDLPWHSPAQRRAVVEMLAAVREHVPERAAVAADFMSSTAVLAHTRRPIVLQPKWESAASRARVRAFWEAFYGGGPEELRRLLVDGYACEYLLVDRRTLWWNRASRYLAGLPASVTEPPAGTAAAALLAGGADGAPPAAPAGYELLWRGSAWPGPGGRVEDVYRLFRLADRGER